MANADPNEVLLTQEQLADRWNMKPDALRNWRTKKEGPPYIKISHKSVRYRMADILAYEAARSKLSKP